MLWMVQMAEVAAVTGQELHPERAVVMMQALSQALESHLLMATVLVALTVITGALIANIFWRHRVEEALRVGEVRSRAAFKTAAHGMALVSTDGRFQTVNPALCTMLGYTEAELTGLSFDTITHPDDLHLSRQCIDRFLAGDKQPCHYEKRYLHKSGHLVWAFLSTTLVHARDGKPLYFVSQIQDITERRQAEAALETARRRLENIIEFLPDATFAIDNDGRVVVWNRAMEELTGVCSDEIVGRGDFAYAQILIGQATPLLIDQINAPDPVSAAEYSRFEQRGDTLFAERFLPKLHNGRGGYFWIKASPLYDADDNVVGAIESLRDITARREAEENLKQANRDLDAFVYTVSHDLRAPLTPIFGYAQYLKSEYREQLNADALDLLSRIESQSQQMVARLENLLDLATLGFLERPGEAVDANRVLDWVRGNLAGRLIEVACELRVLPLPPVPVPETLLGQVFENLLGNALHYAAGSGLPVTVGGEPFSGGVRYFVRDHGPGIPEDERERVFDTFYRGQQTAGRTGTGVGLAIVKKIARLYGGQAWVEETTGGGCTFWVEFPELTEAGTWPGDVGELGPVCNLAAVS